MKLKEARAVLTQVGASITEKRRQINSPDGLNETEVEYQITLGVSNIVAEDGSRRGYAKLYAPSPETGVSLALKETGKAAEQLIRKCKELYITTPGIPL